MARTAFLVIETERENRKIKVPNRAVFSTRGGTGRHVSRAGPPLRIAMYRVQAGGLPPSVPATGSAIATPATARQTAFVFLAALVMTARCPGSDEECNGQGGMIESQGGCRVVLSWVRGEPKA